MARITRTATTVWIGPAGGELLVGSDACPAQQLSPSGRQGEVDGADGVDHWIIRMSLTVSAMVSSIDIDEFQRVVDTAPLSCPISQALQRNVEIDIDPRLE